MATVTKAIFTCDVCGKADDVRTWTFGLDGKKYEIDLCPDDSNGLSKVAAGYKSKARKVTARRRQRRNGHRPRSSRKAKAGDSRPRKEAAAANQAARAADSRPRKERAASKQAAEAGDSRPRGKTAAATQAAEAGDSRPRKETAAAKQAAKTSSKKQEKGIYVYGILPADIEVAAGVPGVGEHAGPLRVIRSAGLAALISEVDRAGRLGSPQDRRAHREILDATALEVPVLPLRFGTVLAGEDAVADELLTPRHDEFAASLERLDGCAEFVVRGRYVDAAVLGGASAENEQTAQLREENTQALRRAMEGVSVASAVKKPADVLDAVHVAFLVALDDESEVERLIEDLAGEWEGRIEVQVLGPMAAYDFVTADSD